MIVEFREWLRQEMFLAEARMELVIPLFLCERCLVASSNSYRPVSECSRKGRGICCKLRDGSCSKYVVLVEMRMSDCGNTEKGLLVFIQISEWTEQAPDAQLKAILVLTSTSQQRKTKCIRIHCASFGRRYSQESSMACEMINTLASRSVDKQCVRKVVFG